METIVGYSALGISLIQLVVLLTIKLNDIKHIENSVKDIKNTIKEISDRQINHECRISRLEGRTSE